MTTILHIDASARGEHSLSRQLSKNFVDTWRIREPDATVITRDVGRNPPPVTTEAWIAAVFTAPEERTADQRAAVRLRTNSSTSSAAPISSCWARRCTTTACPPR